VIARTWHGRVPSDKAAAYHAYLLRTGVPGYRATSGNLGVYVLRRKEDGVTHFLLVSLWESWKAIEAFAGSRVDEARYYPEDADYLLELEPTVTHFDVLHAPDGAIESGS
jgi:heme-degrading monooxygenase HmoA